MLFISSTRLDNRSKKNKYFIDDEGKKGSKIFL